jgi:hypothetical protein
MFANIHILHTYTCLFAWVSHWLATLLRLPQMHFLWLQMLLRTLCVLYMVVWTICFNIGCSIGAMWFGPPAPTITTTLLATGCSMGAMWFGPPAPTITTTLLATGCSMGAMWFGPSTPSVTYTLLATGCHMETMVVWTIYFNIHNNTASHRL